MISERNLLEEIYPFYVMFQHWSELYRLPETTLGVLQQLDHIRVDRVPFLCEKISIFEHEDISEETYLTDVARRLMDSETPFVC